MDKKDEILQSLSFWDKLSDSEKEAARLNSYIVSYKHGAMVHSTENDCLGMLFIISGRLRVYLLSDEGREITLFYIRENEPCVLSASCVIKEITFDTQFSADEDSEILIISASTFAALCSANIYVRCFMYELTTKRFSTVMWVMQQILFMGFDKRLSLFLYNECEQSGSYDLTLTHDAIAKSIGSAREVVTRMLHRFASEGLCELKRGHIIIKDIDGLKKLSS